jgi:hypothetical protein
MGLDGLQNWLGQYEEKSLAPAWNPTQSLVTVLTDVPAS